MLRQKNTKSKNTQVRTSYDKQSRQDNTRRIVTHMPRPTNDQTVQKNTKMVDLDYELNSTIFANPGGPGAVDILKPNSTYDFLLSVFTIAVQFYGYVSALLQRNLVKYIEIFQEMATLEQFPIDCYYFETVNNPSIDLGTRTGILSMAGTAACKWKATLGEQYVQVAKFFKRIYPGRILGNLPEYMGSGDYACNANSDPAKLLYCAFAYLSSQSTMPNGLTVRLSVKLRLKMYSLVNITSPLFLTELELLSVMRSSILIRLESAEDDSKREVSICRTRRSYYLNQLKIIDDILTATYKKLQLVYLTINKDLMEGGSVCEKPTQVVDYLTRKGKGEISRTTSLPGKNTIKIQNLKDFINSIPDETDATYEPYVGS